MTKPLGIPNIEKQIDLRCSAEHAFNVFTKKISIWWPLSTHSCFEDDSLKVVIEEKMNGKIIEYSKSGETSCWGEIVEWNPPKKFAMTWHPSSPENEATLVSVEFMQMNESCRVKLVHSNWERRKDPKIRDGYDKGWDSVLGLFVASVNKIS